MRVLATDRCPMVQVNPVQQSVMAYGIVPIPVTDESQDRPIALTALEAKAALRIDCSLGL